MGGSHICTLRLLLPTTRVRPVDHAGERCPVDRYTNGDRVTQIRSALYCRSASMRCHHTDRIYSGDEDWTVVLE